MNNQPPGWFRLAGGTKTIRRRWEAMKHKKGHAKEGTC